MRKDDVFPSKYLKASDLDDREPTVTIDRVVMEKLGTDEKPVVYFTGKTKGVVLNKMNWERLEYMYGEESDDWTGKPITLYTELATYQGKTGPAIRVKKPVKGNGGRPQLEVRDKYDLHTNKAPQPTGDFADDDKEIPW